MKLTVCRNISLLIALNAPLCASLYADSFIGSLHSIKAHASTVPRNGDVNPYGVALVPPGVPTGHGTLLPQHILVSNFNNSMNLQGTGTTIVQVSPGDGSTKLFAQIDPGSLPGPCPGGVGLTTGLVVLKSGWVIVGSLPTTDGTAATALAGCLLVLNSSGRVVETISGPNINGPWDMTALDQGTTATLFVSNVLDGTVAAGGLPVTNGTVLRIVLSIPAQASGVPTVVSQTVIGSGFSQRTDPAALVIGVTGLGLAPDGTLYVADTLANRIAAISHATSLSTTAGTGVTVSGGGALNGPLGLAIAPNGDIVTVNSNDGNMVETKPSGTQAAVKGVDVTGTGGGTLFGLAIESQDVYFVNDGNNTLDRLQ